MFAIEPPWPQANSSPKRVTTLRSRGRMQLSRQEECRAKLDRLQQVAAWRKQIYFASFGRLFSLSSTQFRAHPLRKSAALFCHSAF